jgi:hypothetical protein
VVGLQPDLEATPERLRLIGHRSQERRLLARLELEGSGCAQQLAPAEESQADRMGIPAHAAAMMSHPVEHAKRSLARREVI